MAKLQLFYTQDLQFLICGNSIRPPVPARSVQLVRFFRMLHKSPCFYVTFIFLESDETLAGSV